MKRICFYLLDISMCSNDLCAFNRKHVLKLKKKKKKKRPINYFLWQGRPVIVFSDLAKIKQLIATIIPNNQTL